jgi:hypothetical protein
MAHMEDDLDAAELRELAAKCRRLAGNLSDQVTAAALRQMATDYESLADSKNRASRPEPPEPIIL